MAGGTTHPVTGVGEVLGWKLRREGAVTVVEIRGEVNENADFSDLKQLEGEVVLDLEGVTRINSSGVREWVNFVRGLTALKSFIFQRCSPTVVLQLNTIYNFRGAAKVVSFFAPYICNTCHVDEYRLLVVDEHFPQGHVGAVAPSFRCQRCGGTLVFDELPERYLSFLAEEPR